MQTIRKAIGAKAKPKENAKEKGSPGKDAATEGTEETAQHNEPALKYEYDASAGTWIETPIVVRMEDKPFASGAMRNAYRMWDVTNAGDGGVPVPFVAKIAKTKVAIEVYEEDIKMQACAREWAERFNAKKVPKKVEFLCASLIKLTARKDKPVCAIEIYVEGEYERYNNNWDWSDDKRNTPQAFSHFTFEESKHTLLVCDLQGVGDVWTDPQIHTKDGRGFGKGNKSLQGFARFFSAHACNSICRFLQLPMVANSLRPKPAMVGTPPPDWWKPPAAPAGKAKLVAYNPALHGPKDTKDLSNAKTEIKDRDATPEKDATTVDDDGAPAAETAGVSSEDVAASAVNLSIPDAPKVTTPLASNDHVEDGDDDVDQFEFESPSAGSRSRLQSAALFADELVIREDLAFIHDVTNQEKAETEQAAIDALGDVEVETSQQSNPRSSGASSDCVSPMNKDIADIENDEWEHDGESRERRLSSVWSTTDEVISVTGDRRGSLFSLLDDAMDRDAGIANVGAGAGGGPQIHHHGASLSPLTPKGSPFGALRSPGTTADMSQDADVSLPPQDDNTTVKPNTLCAKCRLWFFSASGSSVLCTACRTPAATKGVDLAAVSDPHNRDCLNCGRAFYTASGTGTHCIECRPKVQVANGGGIGGSDGTNSAGTNRRCEGCQMMFFSASGVSTHCVECRNKPTNATKAPEVASPGPIDEAQHKMRVLAMEDEVTAGGERVVDGGDGGANGTVAVAATTKPGESSPPVAGKAPSVAPMCGLGMTLAPVADQQMGWKVIGIAEGGGAQASGGVHIGDFLMEVDGCDMRCLTLDVVRHMILGPLGSTVNLTMSTKSWGRVSKKNIKATRLSFGKGTPAPSPAPVARQIGAASPFGPPGGGMVPRQVGASPMAMPQASAVRQIGR